MESDSEHALGVFCVQWTQGNLHEWGKAARGPGPHMPMQRSSSTPLESLRKAL